jgi:uncharacterized membrane protein
MASPILSHKRADGVSTGIFLITLGVLSYYHTWWPWILLSIWLALITRQFLRGRIYDMALTTLIFGGLFCLFYFGLSWDVLAPVLFTVGGLYIIFREYFVSKERVGEEKIDDAAKEIDDAEHDNK